MKPDKIDEFLEGLLKEKEITDLQSETKAKVLAKMREVLLDEAEKEVYSRLSDAKNKELTDKMSGNLSDDEIAAFLEDAGVNINDVMNTTMVLYRKFYLEEA